MTPREDEFHRIARRALSGNYDEDDALEHAAAPPRVLPPEVLELFVRFVRLNPELPAESSVFSSVLDAYALTVPERFA